MGEPFLLQGVCALIKRLVQKLGAVGAEIICNYLKSFTFKVVMLTYHFSVKV